MCILWMNLYKECYSTGKKITSILLKDLFLKYLSSFIEAKAAEEEEAASFADN